MTERDAEVVIAAGSLLHCLGMAIHRTDHERYSLFLAADKLPSLLADIYEEPQRTLISRRGDARDHLPPHEGQAVHGRGRHRAGRGRARHGAGPRAGAVRGRPREHPFAVGLRIEDVTISAGRDKAVRVEVAMSNSAGIFQVDEGLGRSCAGPSWRSTSRSSRGSTPSTKSASYRSFGLTRC